VKPGILFPLSVAAALVVPFQHDAHPSANVADWLLFVRPLTSPAGPNSGQPHLSVHGDRAVLSWIERSRDNATLKFAVRNTDGWTEARSVASGENWFVNWADVPSVVPLEDGLLAAHWLQKSAASTYAYDVRLAFSSDDGRTWSASTTPHHDGRPTEHGFASLFQAPGRTGLGLIWLDGREMKMDGHEGMGAGTMTVRAATFDRNAKQTSEVIVDDRVCECCPTAAAVTAEGPLVAFRNRTEEEIRDIYVSRFVDDRWTEPAPVHNDNWRIAACPVNGPALSARGRDVAIAWFTGVGDMGQVLAAFSRDAGKTFGAPINIHDSGALGRVDVELLATGSAVVSWIEFTDQRSQFRIRRVDPSGARSPSSSVAAISSNRASGYPRMALRGDELVFAWTDTSGAAPQVRTAAAKLQK
jgi:hypothetical protein